MSKRELSSPGFGAPSTPGNKCSVKLSGRPAIFRALQRSSARDTIAPAQRAACVVGPSSLRPFDIEATRSKNAVAERWETAEFGGLHGNSEIFLQRPSQGWTLLLNGGGGL